MTKEEIQAEIDRLTKECYAKIFPECEAAWKKHCLETNATEGSYYVSGSYGNAGSYYLPFQECKKEIKRLEELLEE